jgi:hypothetical protein
VDAELLVIKDTCTHLYDIRFHPPWSALHKRITPISLLRIEIRFVTKSDGFILSWAVRIPMRSLYFTIDVLGSTQPVTETFLEIKAAGS